MRDCLGVWFWFLFCPLPWPPICLSCFLWRHITYTQFSLGCLYLSSASTFPTISVSFSLKFKSIQLFIFLNFWLWNIIGQVSLQWTSQWYTSHTSFSSNLTSFSHGWHLISWYSILKRNSGFSLKTRVFKYMQTIWNFVNDIHLHYAT